MTTQTQTIKTSPELIKLLGEKLYSLPLPIILLRELIQNSIDASKLDKKPIKVNLDCSRDKFALIVQDSGCGMDEDVLLNTFLSIGASLKQDNSIGGFGIAKVSIFTSDNWYVKTTGGYIDDSLEYNPSINTSVGTKIGIESNYSGYLPYHPLMILSTCNFNDIWVKLDGKKVKNYVGFKRIETLYLSGMTINISLAKAINAHNEKLSDKIIYRINGLTQFIDHLYDMPDNISGKFNVIVDFSGIAYKAKDDSYPFTMSREGITYSLKSRILEAVNGFLSDNYSITREDENSREKIRVIRGYRLSYSSTSYVELMKKPHLDMLRVFETIAKTIAPYIEVGLTDDMEVNAFIRGLSVIYINPYNLSDVMSKDFISAVYSLTHLAIHELSHRESKNHNESFTMEEGRLSYDINFSEILEKCKPYKRYFK